MTDEQALSSSATSEQAAENVGGDGAGTPRSLLRSLRESLRLSPSPPEGRAFHAFLSYSHAADAGLATAMQKGLQRFAKPWYVPHAVRLFRDDASLSVTANLWKEIERALDASEHYILLASPQAAASQWVADEAERWRNTKPSENLLLALTDGELVWDRVAGDFDWRRTTALPRVLQGAFEAEPRFVDLRWARGEPNLSLAHPRFRDAIADLAAPLHGKDKDEIASEEVFQQRRAVRVRRAVAATLVTLAVVAIVAGVAALLERASAISEANVVESNLLASQVVPGGDRQLSSLIAIEAYRLSPTLAARGAILTVANRQLDPPLRDPGGQFILDVAFSPDGQTLVSTGGSEDTTTLWDVATHRQLGTPLGGQTLRLYHAAFSPDGKILATVASDDSIRLWDVATHRQLGSPLLSAEVAARQREVERRLHPSERFAFFNGIAFSPDGRTIATGGLGGFIALWDIVTHHQLGPLFHGQHRAVNRVAFSPDGKMLASASDDHTIQLWDVATHRELGPPLFGHTAEVSSVAFSPDSTMLASASFDKTVRLWDVATHRQLGSALLGHTGEVSSVAFSPDGTTLASAGGTDDTIRLWDLATHVQVGAPLTLPGLGPNGVDFRHDGRLLASANTDGTVRLWTNYPTDYYIRQLCASVNVREAKKLWRRAEPSIPYKRPC